jgi:hypothetical protein
LLKSNWEKIKKQQCMFLRTVSLAELPTWENSGNMWAEAHRRKQPLSFSPLSPCSPCSLSCSLSLSLSLPPFSPHLLSLTHNPHAQWHLLA